MNKYKVITIEMSSVWFVYKPTAGHPMLIPPVETTKYAPPIDVGQHLSASWWLIPLSQWVVTLGVSMV